jgi:hypothetical protein
LYYFLKELKYMGMKNSSLKFFLTGVVLFVFNFSYCQGWEKTFTDSFGAAKGFHVIETQDGGFVIVGDIDLPTGAIRHHIWAVKTDQDGNELWSHIFGYYNVAYQSARAIVETSTGDLLIAGSYFNKATVLKINADGDSLWTKFYGGNGSNAFKDIIKSENGNFIAVGQYEAEANSQFQEVWAMGLNENGDSLWSETYFDPSSFGSSAMNISPLPSDHYLISGGLGGQGFAMEIDAIGEQSWAKTYQLSSEDIMFTGAINNTGDTLLIGGRSSGFAGYSPSLIQTDLSGEILNTVPILTVNFGAITDLVSTNDGGFILTGSSYDFWDQTGFDVGFISKLDSNLDVEWEISYEDSLGITGAAIKQTADGDYIMAGSKQGGMFLKKIGGIVDAVYNFTGDNFSANLYPNPVADQLFIEIPEDSFRQNMSVRFYDALGRLVDQSKINSSFVVIDVAHFLSGFYHYIIYEKERELGSGKVVVR